MADILKIKDSSYYAKDTSSKAIINCDDSAYAYAKRQKQSQKSLADTLSFLLETVALLKSRCDNLEKQLLKISNK